MGYMNAHPCRLDVRLLLLAALLAGTPCPAALPYLNEQPWVGHFLGCSNKKFTFGLTSEAAGKLTPLGRSGKPVSYLLVLPVAFTVEEVLPDGRAITKKILTESLTTKDSPTAKPGHVSFRGSVTGGATFEGHVEVDHGVVALGGRLLDPGTSRKNPLRFGIRVTFPDAYRNQPARDKQAARAFENLLKDDRLGIARIDDKRVRLTGNDKLGPDSTKINGAGIANLKVEIAAYQGKVFEFAATPHSKLELWNRLEQPVHDGFTINWFPDPATDPDAKARLRIEVK